MENSLRRLKLDTTYAISRYMADIAGLAVKSMTYKVDAEIVRERPVASWRDTWQHVDDVAKEGIFSDIRTRLIVICQREGGK